MSKSPKALLPSSLSLASFSRALPAANAAQRQSASIASTSANRTASVHAHAVESSASEAVGRPPQSRPASPLSTQPARRSTHAARVASHRAVYAPSSSSCSRSSAGPLLRRARSVAASPSSGHYYPSFSDASSSACASSSSSVAGPSRYFHSTHCTRHQQAISPASGGGGGGGGIVPPPGSEHHASSSGALGGSAGGASGADGSFHAKHQSSLPLASHDGPTLLSGSVAPGSGSGSSPPTALDAASSSTTPASTSQTQQHHSSSTSSNSIPATLFSHAPPASLPSHALPAFFGSALNIARRSNLVFRNGAYGIPKADHHRARVSAKGKEKAISLAEASDAEHYLSVGVGEDAYFLRPDSLGVADGVGGWSGHAGANSARWARKFMHHCSAELARYENVDDDMFLHYYEVDPVDVMQRAYEKTLSECKEEGTIGSSTALLAILRNDELRLANLGDCSCCVIRGDEYIFRTEEQQHRFNYPFQAGTNAKDTPAKDAQKFAIKVRKDDIVILSSDGLVDNVFSDDMLEEVLRFVGSATPPPPNPSSSTPPNTGAGPPRFSLRRFSPQAVSEALCHRAKSVYEDQRAVASPFQQRAMEEGIHYAGGKIDDISCLVGVVGELEASPNRRDVT